MSTIQSGASSYSQSMISGSAGTDAGTPTAPAAGGVDANTPATESPLAGLTDWSGQAILDRLTGKTSAPQTDANGLTQKPTDAASSTADALAGSNDQ